LGGLIEITWNAFRASEGRGGVGERAETRGELKVRNRTGTGSAQLE